MVVFLRSSTVHERPANNDSSWQWGKHAAIEEKDLRMVGRKTSDNSLALTGILFAVLLLTGLRGWCTSCRTDVHTESASLLSAQGGRSGIRVVSPEEGRNRHRIPPSPLRWLLSANCTPRLWAAGCLMQGRWTFFFCCYQHGEFLRAPGNRFPSLPPKIGKNDSLYWLWNSQEHSSYGHPTKAPAKTINGYSLRMSERTLLPRWNTSCTSSSPPTASWEMFQRNVFDYAGRSE